MLPESKLSHGQVLSDYWVGEHIGADIAMDGHQHIDAVRGPMTKALSTFHLPKKIVVGLADKSVPTRTHCPSNVRRVPSHQRGYLQPSPERYQYVLSLKEGTTSTKALLRQNE